MEDARNEYLYKANVFLKVSQKFPHRYRIAHQDTEACHKINLEKKDGGDWVPVTGIDLAFGNNVFPQRF
jgi:hypothetical protein